MKKNRRKPTTKARKSSAPKPVAETPNVDRRGTLRLLRNLAIAAPVVGVAGYFTTQRVQASICELDLSKIGDGLPSVVQVHDPSCNLCVTLQRQTRRSLRAYDDDTHHFLIANIASVEGQTFARLHGVGHVTLVFLNGAGEQVGVVRGPLTDAAVDAAVAAHLGAAT